MLADIKHPGSAAVDVVIDQVTSSNELPKTFLPTMLLLVENIMALTVTN